MEDHSIDVLHDFTGKMTPGDTITRLHDVAMIYCVSGYTEVFIEDVGFQGVMVKLLEEKRDKAKVYYQITPVRPNGHKETRIRALFPFYQFGQIRYGGNLLGSRLEYQLERFPKDKIKDAVDAWSQFCYVLQWPVKAIEKTEYEFEYKDMAEGTPRARVTKKRTRPEGEENYLGKESFLNY